MCRTLTRRLAQVLLLFALLATPARAGPPALTLVGSAEAAAVFDGHVEALRDPGLGLTLADVQEAPFQAVTGRSAGFGYIEDAVWLRLRVVNATEDTADWRLHARSNFLPEFAVWSVDADGGVTLLEDQRPGSVFASRRIAYPELVAAFALPPGKAATLFIRYTSGGSSNLSFAIRTAEGFAALAARQTARNFAFYGMMLLLTGAALLACVLTRRMIFAAYGCYACVAVLFVMHGDGNAFRYLWPGAPAFNAFASVLLGAGLIVFGATFARMFLRTASLHPVLDALLLGLSGLALAMVAATAFGFTQEVKKLLVLAAFLSTVLFTVAGLVAARTRFREVRFYVVAWVGAVIASAIMAGRHWLGIPISEELQFDAMRVVMVADAAMMGLAILDSVNQMKHAQRRALEAALAEARRNLDLSRRLNQLEERHAMAVALAQSNERRLADTAHDLRQPLAALRLNVQRLLAAGIPGAGMPGRGAGPRREDFEESFDYLERLVSVELARHAAPPRAAAAPVAAGGGGDPGHPVAAVLSTVAEMFAPTADARGIALCHVPSRARTTLPPLVLMRIASNLVSNAINYTASGRVLLGVRRHRGGLRLEVHDTGPGLSPEAFRLARARAVRLDPQGQAEGTGLGLAIVDRLCRDHGLELLLCGRRQGGAGILVTLPRA
jgi:signal transduction histidine kinase